MRTLDTLIDDELLKDKTPEECDFIFDLRTAKESFVNQRDGALFILYSKADKNNNGNLVVINDGDYFDSTLYQALIHLGQGDPKIVPMLISVLGKLIYDSKVEHKIKQDVVSEITTYLNELIKIDE